MIRHRWAIGVDSVFSGDFLSKKARFSCVAVAPYPSWSEPDYNPVKLGTLRFFTEKACRAVTLVKADGWQSGLGA